MFDLDKCYEFVFLVRPDLPGEITQASFQTWRYSPSIYSPVPILYTKDLPAVKSTYTRDICSPMTKANVPSTNQNQTFRSKVC